jgi:hypothetical protein
MALVGFVLHMVGGLYVAMLRAQILLKKEDGASNMATRSQLALWMDAVISVLHVVFAKDTEATVYAISSIVHIMYSGAICANHIILQLTSPEQWRMSQSQCLPPPFFVTKSGTFNNNSSNAMEIDIVIETVMEFVGIGNWEQVHTFTAVCKCWRHSSLPHLSNIGEVPMDGGGEPRLNVSSFLHLLQSEHFRNVQAIFIPCGKTKG